MRRSGWEEPLEPAPLGVREIAWIEWCHAVQRRPCRPCPSLQNTLSEPTFHARRLVLSDAQAHTLVAASWSSPSMKMVMA